VIPLRPQEEIRAGKRDRNYVIPIKIPCPRFAISADIKGRKEEKMEEKKKKIPEMGKEYPGSIVGLEGAVLFYQGCNRWVALAEEGKEELTRGYAPHITMQVLEYLNT